MATGAQQAHTSSGKKPVRRGSKRLRQARSAFQTRNLLLREQLQIARRVAPTEANVLILGETGTGKELLSRWIHEVSGRTGPFVTVNCGAIPETLVEAELFGHVEGAFTGASGGSEGLFRHAAGGTLLLDEVGNLPLQAQISTLRALQERRVRPVGGAQEYPVDVRVLAATNVSLADAVAEGEFRLDLLHRLDVIRIVLPPLRERPEDLEPLFRRFLAEACQRNACPHPRLAPSFFQEVRSYPWPGNVRQVQNYAERLALTHDEHRLYDGSAFLDFIGSQEYSPRRPGQALHVSEQRDDDALGTLEDAVARAERSYLTRLLRAHDGRREDAAKAAGVSRRTLLRKLKRHGMDSDSGRVDQQLS